MVVLANDKLPFGKVPPFAVNVLAAKLSPVFTVRWMFFVSFVVPELFLFISVSLLPSEISALTPVLLYWALIAAATSLMLFTDFGPILSPFKVMFNVVLLGSEPTLCGLPLPIVNLCVFAFA